MTSIDNRAYSDSLKMFALRRDWRIVSEIKKEFLEGVLPHAQ